MLVLPPEVTHKHANGCLLMLAQGLPKQTENPVVVDATGLARFDSSALAVLLEFRRHCLAQGKAMSIHAMPERLRHLAGVYGIDELLPAHEGQSA